MSDSWRIEWSSRGILSPSGRALCPSRRILVYKWSWSRKGAVLCPSTWRVLSHSAWRILPYSTWRELLSSCLWRVLVCPIRRVLVCPTWKVVSPSSRRALGASRRELMLSSLHKTSSSLTRKPVGTSSRWKLRAFSSRRESCSFSSCCSGKLWLFKAGGELAAGSASCVTVKWTPAPSTGVPNRARNVPGQTAALQGAEKWRHCDKVDKNWEASVWYLTSSP